MNLIISLTRNVFDMLNSVGEYLCMANYQSRGN